MPAMYARTQFSSGVISHCEMRCKRGISLAIATRSVVSLS